MKQLKMMMMALVATIALSLTSCMNENTSKYDDQGYVTIDDGSFTGLISMQLDGSDITLYPTNPDVLKLKDGSYLERAKIGFNFVEGQKYTEGTKTYNVTIVDYYGVPAIDLNLRPDTLKNSYVISDFYMWSSPKHLNVITNFRAIANYSLAMYIDTAKVDVSQNILPLVLTLHEGGQTTNASPTNTFEGSWRNQDIRVTPLGLDPSQEVKVQVSINKDDLYKMLEVKHKFSN